MHRHPLGELMLQEQILPIDFGGGVDTKTDSKGVVAGKFLRLENAVFTNPKRVVKRNGYTSIGSFGAPKMSHGYGNELIVADSHKLYSYSSNQDAKIDMGYYTSIALDRTLVSEEVNPSGLCDMAILGNYALYGWGTADTVYGSVVDLSTGTVLVENSIATGLTAEPFVKCCCLGGTTLALAYFDHAANAVKAVTVTFSGGGVVSFSAASSIATSMSSPGVFDMIATSTGGAVVYKQTATPGITIATVSTALAVSTATQTVTTGLSTVVAISSTSNGNLWIYWTEATDDAGGNLTALSIYYAVYSSSLAAVLGRTLIKAVGTPYYVSTMMAEPNSATQQTLYYGQYTTNNAGSKHELEYTDYVTITSGGVVGTPSIFATGVIPFSHHFTVSSTNYAMFIYRMSDITVAIGGSLTAPTQTTYFMVDLSVAPTPTLPPVVVARFAAGAANTFASFAQVPLAMANVASFSSTKVYAALGVAIQLNALGTLGTYGAYVDASVGIYSYAFDFNSDDAYKATDISNVVILNGALTKLYDGALCTEFGFHLSPEITKLSQDVGGGIADGAYSFIVIFQWIDSKGNLHRSQPSEAKAITVSAGGGTATIKLNYTASFLSQKSLAQAYIYGTAASGSLYYLQTVANCNPGSVGIYQVTLSSAASSAEPEPYTYPGSSVLENTAPPPSMVMVGHNNRLFLVDAENPDTDIWYTKSNQPQLGVSPSSLLLEQIDPKYGNITALAEMDEKLIVFKQNGIFAQSGDGFDDTGTSESFSFPQAIPSDVGCQYQKSVVLTPEGVMFRSKNGIYMLGRAMNVGYIGAEVEQYNSQDVTGATLVPGKSQIRFLTSSGSALVYDYIFKQWSIFTNHTGYSSTTWNGLYVYATTGGNVYKESSGSYLDNATAFAILAQTSWLHLGSVQGFQRVRRFIMLGDYANGNSASHALSIQAAYDFSTTFSTAISYSLGAAASSGVFQYRERLPQQKCDTVSLLIQETTTGDSAEYIDLSNMSFEVGVKRGVNKLRGQQSVG